MSGSKSNSAAKNKTNTAVDCMSMLGKFLVCLCFLRVGVGVGGGDEEGLCPEVVTSEEDPGEPEVLAWGRGGTRSQRPHTGRQGLCPPPYSYPEKRWVPLRSPGREHRWPQHPGEVSLGLPAAGGDWAWFRGRAAWIGCGSRPTAHELVSARPSRLGLSRTLSSRAPQCVPLSHARNRALPGWMEGS